MPTLFEETTLKGMKLRNRFVRSATWLGLADADGFCTDSLVARIRELARGELGLIVSGHAYVSREGQAGAGQLGIHTDAHVAPLARMADAVHEEGGAVALQLAHAGGKAWTKGSGMDARGPSVMEKEGEPICRAMTGEEIRAVAAAFAQGAARAQQAGFDAVQLHAAHGYLLSQFLAPFFNKREDEYGGSPEGRARLLREVVQSVRAAVGTELPILIKINSEYYSEPCLPTAEVLRVVDMLQADGLDACEFSGADPVRKANSARFTGEPFFKTAARAYKAAARGPLILVGGVRSYAQAERLVTEGVTDYVAMCRPLIREPGLVARWHAGDTADAACISCNLCFRPASTGKGAYCVAAERAERAQR